MHFETPEPYAARGALHEECLQHAAEGELFCRTNIDSFGEHPSHNAFRRQQEVIGWRTMREYLWKVIDDRHQQAEKNSPCECSQNIGFSLRPLQTIFGY